MVPLRAELLRYEIVQLGDASERVGSIVKNAQIFRVSCMQPDSSVIVWPSDAGSKLTRGVADEPVFEDGRCGARTREHPEFVRNLSGISRNG